MGDKSAIEWTDASWNPIRGCSRVSEGCRHCYAESVANRFSGPGKPYHGLVNASGRWNGEVRFIEEHLADPLRWTKPRRIFVNSMSDLFHEKVEDDWLHRIYHVMERAHQHTFQILTKRPERMQKYLAWRWGEGRIPSRHIWHGVSVEHQAAADERIPLLLQTPAAVRFLSVEPLLGPVDLGRWLPTSGAATPVKQTGAAESRDARTAPARTGEERAGCGRAFALDWIIVGGESGPGARPCDLAWIRSVVHQAKAAGVPCFVKQLGARPEQPHYDADGVHVSSVPMRLRDRKGGDPAEWPADLNVREFPEPRRP